ncbi:MAG: CotH kinase family protein [Bacteroidetes bacterium]|nr:CotH kinase family protein [Bacteroidota bacterium]
MKNRKNRFLQLPSMKCDFRPLRLLIVLSVFLQGISFIRPVSAQNFYALDTIQKIEISFAQSNWDYILDTAKQGSDSYTLSQWVKINGVVFDSAGVKFKGNSSYNPANAKNPFHIELDHFKEQDYLGFKDIKLSNGYNEPSFLREILLYTMFSQYAPASRANFAQVYVNGQYIGLYTNVESVTKTFLEDRFSTKNNTFVFADNGGCDLRYKGNDTTLYYQPYTLKPHYGWTDLMHLCDSLNNNINGIEQVLDVDRTLWYLAFTNALVILDSYLGNAKHNYYLYKYQSERFTPIIWDLNGGLGVFARANNGPSLTIPQLQNLSPLLHATDSMWPLVKNLLSVPMYKRMYIAHMKTIMSENISNGNYITFAQQIQSIADTAVFSDPNKFGTYTQFIDNLNQNVVLGPKTVPGITVLMSARNAYLNATPEFTQIPPSITNVQSSDTFPPLLSSVFITASISNASNVYLGFRSSALERFSRVAMLDDGLHGDGPAGDGIYGAALAVSSAEMQYYLYAENSNAGIFSPQRAEHEYYRLFADYTSVLPGDLVINELMALNSSIVQNYAGDYADWIELYNASVDTISLNDLYLSDDSLNLLKWKFPDGWRITPDGYQIVWADEGAAFNELHCSFKLSGGGEAVYLSYPNGEMIDSIVFGQQVTNIAFARSPNGTGGFTFLSPTFNANNNFAGIDVLTENEPVMLYPNPASDFLFAGMNMDHFSNVQMQNTMGEVVRCDMSMNSDGLLINVSLLDNGMYFLVVQFEEERITKKFVVSR